MVKIKNIIITIFVSLIIIPCLTYSNAEPNSFSNNENIIQTPLLSNNTTNASVNLAALPAGSDYISLEIQWIPSGGSLIDLGRVDANGLTYDYYNDERIILDATTHILLYIRATDDFTNGQGNTIPISNFKYSGYNGLDTPVITPKSFTTDPDPGKLISRMKKQKTETYANFHLTVPANTEGGTYTTTIIHTAIPHNL
ncbi:MAG: hypothetical protein ACPK7O_05050 [Methanobacterium sp.]